jgi:hypothetical protein
MPQTPPGLPIFALVLSVAGTVSAQPAVGPRNTQISVSSAVEARHDDPAWIVAQAAAAIQSRTAVSANLRYRAELRGATMLGAGAYWQQGRGPKRVSRLELRMQIGDLPSTLTQVNDKTHLWVHRTLGDKPSLTRVDLRRVAREAGDKQASAAGAALGVPMAGGLPQILIGLVDQCEFTGLEQTAVQSIPMWVVEGTWNRARLVQFLPQQQAAIAEGKDADLTKLAQHIPDRVSLVIGQDDLFPYRIEYTRGEQRQVMLLLEFFNVRIGEPINPQQFEYRPPADLEISDVTDDFLKRGQPEQGGAGGK